MKKNFKVIFIIGLSLILNFGGKYISEQLSLPVWFDSLGTCLTAYAFGPVCGAIVGAGMNIAYGFFDGFSFIYSIVSIAIGVSCGIMARRGNFETFWGTCRAGLVLTFVSFGISLPLNLLIYDGYSGNVWGDGILDMLMETSVPKVFSAALGEFAIDYVDKMIVSLLFFFMLTFKNNRLKLKNIVTVFVLTCIAATTLFSSFSDVEAISTENIIKNRYATTVYNDANGLPGGEANDVTFGSDGCLWVGTYGGLYKYDGNNFKFMNEFEMVKNVNHLFTDEEGRIWIGTNDSGLAVCVGDEIINVLDSNDGLSSDSVKAINQDSFGNYYIGTSKALNIVNLHAGIRISKTFEDVEYVHSITTDKQGNAVVVDGSGTVFVFRNAKLLYSVSDILTDDVFSCACFSEDGHLYMGTYSNEIYVFELTDKNLKQVTTISTRQVNNIRSLEENNGNIYVCADNGVGFLTSDNLFHEIQIGDFSTSIDNMDVDYQGNLWFTSSRLGLLKVTETVFSNIYTRANRETDVINAVTCWNDKYYLGSDDGLDVFDAEFQIVEDPLQQQLQGQRVRNLTVDHNNHLWISTTSGDGLFEVEEDGTVHIYNESAGTICDRFRSVCELSNGVMAVAEDNGIDFIKNGQVIHSITQSDGLGAGMVLSICEAKDGKIYAGTDGGGVAVISDYKIVSTITKEDGLTSGVVLRVVEDQEGLFFVVTNGIIYYSFDGKIRYLSNFPYSNCFDIQTDKAGNLWVLSSAGIFVLNRDEMLSNDTPEYTLFNSRAGLVSSITANSWTYMSKEGVLYVCCDNGCYEIETAAYDLGAKTFRMIVDSAYSDGKKISVSRGEQIQIDADVKDLTIYPTVLNYSLNEPYIGYQLLGYDEEETIVSSKELLEINYSNLKNGQYTFVLTLYNDSMDTVLEKSTYTIVKSMRIYDHLWFRFYVAAVYVVFLMMITWMIARRKGDEALARAQEKYATEKAIASDKAKSMFLANMSHEIRTPINAILGTNEMIQRESTDANILEYARDINSAGRTLLSLINDILDFSKIESGKMNLVFVEYNLRDLVADLEGMIAERAHKKGIDLLIEVDENLPKKLYGDDVRVRQIITNLLTNAVKYTKEGSVKLVISRADKNAPIVKDEGVDIKVEVIDTGIGIKEEDLENLFKMFTRIEEERNRNIEGTGLGINITTNLLELMNSRLQVDSVYGQGSNFYFVLNQKVVVEEPIGDYHKRETEQVVEETKKIQRVAPTARVLLVDDTVMNLKVEARLLKRTKVMIDQEESGFKALERLRNEKYDLVFLDHMMPEMDGIETLKRARSEGIIYDTPVVILTANAISGAKEMYLNEGFDGYLSKPVKGEDIENMLFDMISPDKIQEEEV